MGPVGEGVVVDLEVMLDIVGAELQVVNKSSKEISLKENEFVTLTRDLEKDASSVLLPINYSGLAKSNCIDFEMDEGCLEEAIMGGQDAGYNQGCVDVNDEGVVSGEVGNDKVVIGVNDVVDIGVNDEGVEDDEVLHDEGVAGVNDEGVVGVEGVAGVNDEGGNDKFSKPTKGGGNFEVVATIQVGIVFHSMEDIEKYYRSYEI